MCTIALHPLRVGREKKKKKYLFSIWHKTRQLPKIYADVIQVHWY